jgi:ectoine hydroxylase-related dioxygenase (phytanoyl-CoA dioxygenase family)
VPTPSHADLDRAAYARDGYVLVRDLVAPADVAALRREALRFDHGRGLGVQIQLVHRSAVVREFVTRGPQVAYAVALLGPNVAFTHQQFIVKNAEPERPGRTDIPWHQDNGYGRLEPPRDLTVWIALDACTLDNGCLWVLPESHHAGLVPHDDAGALRAARVDETGIAVPMQAGDALLFGSLLLHRSLPNTTTATRVALYLRYCDPDVVMVNEDSKPVLDDAYSWMVAGEAR